MWSPFVRLNLYLALCLLPAAVSCLANRGTVVRSPLFSSTLLHKEHDRIRKFTGRTRRPPRRSTTSTTTSLSTVSSGTLGVAVLPRGGGASPNLAIAATAAFNKFVGFVGASKTRCLLLLLASIVLESYATALSKQAKDTGKMVVFVRACALYLLCMVGFNISLAKIDVSVAYALWGAIGTVLVTAAGFLFFGESLDLIKVICLAMIMTGVVGLNLRG